MNGWGLIKKFYYILSDLGGKKNRRREKKVRLFCLYEYIYEKGIKGLVNCTYIGSGAAAVELIPILLLLLIVFFESTSSVCLFVV